MSQIYSQRAPMVPATPSAIRPIAHRVADRLVFAALVLGATALTLALDAAQIRATLHGGFGDPDDAMRLVEVRSWLTGQSWFDMTATRLDPPAGSFMHWSRLIDLPMAAMIRLFGLVTNPAMAERLAAVAVPTLWLLALYAGIMRLATLLVGRAGRLPVLLGTMFSGVTLVQFLPGRIGHHAPETVTLVFAVGAAIAALDPCRSREAALAGCLVALSLAMSLETLPYDAVLVGTLVLFWVMRGEALAPMLGWLATGLLAGLPLLFLATVGPARWTATACDSFSAAHLGAGLIGGIGLLGLARFSPRLPRWPTRALAVAVAGACALAFEAAVYPACLHSPFAAVDPLVHDLWLRHVVESLPLHVFAQSRPMLGLAIVMPIALGLVGCFAAVAAERGVPRLRFLLLGILSATGLALSFWQVRVVGSVAPLALCGGVYLIAVVRNRMAARGVALAPAASAGILAFASTVWLLLLPNDATNSVERKVACLAPEAFGPLANLPTGSAVAPMDSGAHLLEATSLSVFAAPYHRNDDGNRFAFEVFLAKPEAAAAMLAARRVAYVMTCPAMSEMDRLAARSPDGLAAALRDDRAPAYLKPVPLAGTPYQVYAVAPGGR